MGPDSNKILKPGYKSLYGIFSKMWLQQRFFVLWSIDIKDIDLEDLKTHKNAGSIVLLIYFTALNFCEKIKFVLTLVFFLMIHQ